MDKLPLFQEGSTINLLSTSEANKVIRILNTFLGSIGRNGVKIIKAESGWSFELSDGLQKKLIGPGGGDNGEIDGGGGEGGLAWRGIYDQSLDYFEGQIMIVVKTEPTGPFTPDLVDISDSLTTGTYICIQDAPGSSPAPWEEGGNLYWETFAAGQWNSIILDTDGYTLTLDANTGLIQFSSKSTDFAFVVEEDLLRVTGSGGTIELQPSLCFGKTMAVRKLDYCNGSGETKKILAIASDPEDLLDS